MTESTWTTSDAILRQRVQAVVDTIAVRHFRYPVRWRLTDPDVAPVAVTLIAGVLDRETGQPAEVLCHYSVGTLMAASDDEIAAFLWTSFRVFLEHEAGECFYRAGKRVHDPHARRDTYRSFDERP